MWDGIELSLLQAGYPYETVQQMDADVVVRKFTSLKSREAIQQQQAERAREES